MLWDKYFRKKIGFSRFLKDLRASPLRARSELRRISLRYNGSYTFVCKLCLQKDKKPSKKKSHKPECSKGHPWNENRLLVFEKTKGSQEIVILDQENPSEEAKDIQHCFKELISCRFTEDEVVDESSTLNQSQIDIVRNASKPKKGKKPKKSDDHRKEGDDDGEKEKAENNCNNPEMDYDTDLEDVMTVWDSDEEEREEQLTDDQSSKKEPYYMVTPEPELWNLLREDPSKYKLCTIHLDGPFAAKCKVLEKHPVDNIREIEIRGRMNCGQTLEGDEVVVEVKSTEVLDSKEEVVSTEWTQMTMPATEHITEELEMPYDQPREGIESVKQKSEVKIETRGIVVGVTRKKLNRKAYTFLCRADRYQYHLMKPLDGVAPKIHVKRIHGLSEIVVVYAMQDGVPQQKKLVKLDPLKRESTLFVVRYLKWDPGSIYPLGYVTHVIHSGETIARSQQILNILHQVPTRPNSTCEKEASKMDVYIPEDKTWNDLRKLFVVSIDPPNCKDVDDALSVEKIEEGEFRVGVHIADVSHYVEKDDVIDKNARRRATSYYAAMGKVYGMLPIRLSEDILSLREGEERLVLSVFFHITMQTGVVRRQEICRSVIINRKQLTYEEAEAYIDQIGTARSWQLEENDLENVISNLHLIAVE